MKKIKYFAIALALLTLLCGCGGRNNENTCIHNYVETVVAPHR